jgi:hypothetical protein
MNTSPAHPYPGPGIYNRSAIPGHAPLNPKHLIPQSMDKTFQFPTARQQKQSSRFIVPPTAD